MSRIQKYKESLCKFIKDKSCLIKDCYIDNADISEYIYNQTKNNDLIFSILLLTIMNSQNKKNHISMQGYYVSTSIEIFNLILHFIENKNQITSKFNIDYSKTYNDLNLYANKSLHQNLESIKNTYQDKPHQLINVILASLNLFNNSLKNINSFNNFKFEFNDNSCDYSIIKCYLKSNDEIIKKFKTYKQVNRASFQKYIDNKYTNVCETSVLLGWLLGGGDIKDISKLKKLCKYFAMIYKISKDFENLNNDIKNANNYYTNYVINYGLNESYEIFLENKQKFIEESMLQDIYTNTIKEIIDTIELNVDTFIDQTSPDLKSNYSSLNNSMVVHD